jgi:preprotein translocase subunit SecE
MRRLQEREDRRLKKKKQAPRRKPRPQDQLPLFQRLKRFMREVRAEMKRVSWPTREQLVAFSAVTIITSTALTLYVFALDFAFKEGILILLGGT